MSLGALGHLGTTLGSQRLTCAFQAAILEDFSSKWGPHSEPNNHTGGLQVGIGACNDVFLEGLFQDLHFTPNQVPKTDIFCALLEMLGKAPVSTRAQFSRSQFEFYVAPFWTPFELHLRSNSRPLVQLSVLKACRSTPKQGLISEALSGGRLGEGGPLGVKIGGPNYPSRTLPICTE